MIPYKAFPCSKCGSKHAMVKKDSDNLHSPCWIECFECGNRGPQEFNVDIAKYKWNELNKVDNEP